MIIPRLLSISSILAAGGPAALAAAANQCFEDHIELGEAIDGYRYQGCADDDQCNLTKTYGWPMNSWCVSNITDMSRLFQDKDWFNENISSWDVSRVTDMHWMFYNASSFDGDLSSWNVSLVKRMDTMFRYASSFNSDISSWDVSSVTTMTGMFYRAEAFNANISSWDVSTVSNMMNMFRWAVSFNQDLCAWGDKFPYWSARAIFFYSGCTFQKDPQMDKGGPFCASSCNDDFPPTVPSSAAISWPTHPVLFPLIVLIGFYSLG